jgi:hypothetical protein
MVGARRLGLLRVLVPLIAAAGVGTGYLLKEPLSRLHPSVRLAERIAGEELGRYRATTVESQAFRASDRPNADLYAEARSIREKSTYGGMALGGFMGLVIAGKLVAVSLRRRRDGYEPDRGSCFSCGRCFKYCPVKE